jgi:hypothetical protein
MNNTGLIVKFHFGRHYAAKGASAAAWDVVRTSSPDPSPKTQNSSQVTKRPKSWSIFTCIFHDGVTAPWNWSAPGIEDTELGVLLNRMRVMERSQLRREPVKDRGRGVASLTGY